MSLSVIEIPSVFVARATAGAARAANDDHSALVLYYKEKTHCDVSRLQFSTSDAARIQPRPFLVSSPLNVRAIRGARLVVGNAGTVNGGNVNTRAAFAIRLDFYLDSTTICVGSDFF